jgi:hypothetical protein
VLTETFTGISRDAFERMKNDLRRLGASVPEGDDCAIRHRGVSGSLSYSEQDRCVEVQIIQKPMFVSNGRVSSWLRDIMKRYTDDGSSERS